MTRLNKEQIESNTQKALEELNDYNVNPHPSSIISQKGRTNIVDINISETTYPEIEVKCLKKEIEQYKSIISSKDEEIKTLKELIEFLQNKSKL